MSTQGVKLFTSNRAGFVGPVRLDLDARGRAIRAVPSRRLLTRRVGPIRPAGWERRAVAGTSAAWSKWVWPTSTADDLAGCAAQQRRLPPGLAGSGSGGEGPEAGTAEQVGVDEERLALVVATLRNSWPRSPSPPAVCGGAGAEDAPAPRHDHVHLDAWWPAPWPAHRGWSRFETFLVLSGFAAARSLSRRWRASGGADDGAWSSFSRVEAHRRRRGCAARSSGRASGESTGASRSTASVPRKSSSPSARTVPGRPRSRVRWRPNVTQRRRPASSGVSPPSRAACRRRREAVQRGLSGPARVDPADALAGSHCLQGNRAAPGSP